MPKPDTIQSVDAYWISYLGCPLADPQTPRAVVVPHAALHGYHGAFLFRRDRFCILSVPAALLAPATQAVLGHEPEGVFDSAWLAGLFGEAVEQTIGPTWLGYADDIDLRPVATEGVRLLDADDDVALHRLARACRETEWEHSGIRFDRPPVYGCFRGEEIWAAAGYERWGGRLAHIGVVTHPAHRGRGCGKAVVSAIAAKALREGLIPQYRTLEANQASIAIGRSLGFQEYAVTIAVRFRDSPA
jgi:RimJ/RimL family protein N-acetyltransferase